MEHEENISDEGDNTVNRDDEGEEEIEDEEEDSDEETDSDEDSDEETEPKLKYERIGNDLTNILSKDAASCMAVHPKFLALGTHWGVIHILDHCGDNIRNKELTAHSTTVNQISIDDNGDFIASCSDDGKVMISGLYSTEHNHTINFDRPIKAVALDPFFYKSGTGRRFITGDDKLSLHEKGFLNRYKTTILHQGEGQIRNIKWRANYIAWSNDLGVKIYDTSAKRRITFIARENSTLRPELYQCNLSWKDDTTLLVGWAENIKVCVVKDRPLQDSRDLPNRYVEIVAMFNTEFFVCGLAPFQEHVVVLSYSEDDEELPGTPRPHLRIIEPNMDFYNEVSNDALSIRGFNDYRCKDYHLETIVDEHTFFIVSPKDIILARQRDQDDHITWLLDHGLYEEAMTAASEHAKDLKKHNYQDIGRQYLDYLIEDQEYRSAARLCVKILGKSKELWEEQVLKFAQIRQLMTIAPYLPRGEPTLSPAMYEMVLNDFLQHDCESFLKMIKEWPSDLYSIQTLVNAVLDKLDRDRTNITLMQSLAELYVHDKRYDHALGVYLRLKHKDAFQLIHKHNLFDSISDKIELLMEFDKDAAVKLLLDNIDKVPVEKVVSQLHQRPGFLYIYLDRLFHKDPHLGQDYHAQQIQLYAEFDRPKLLPFLRSSNYYPLQEALVECENRFYIPEMVFLLGRMGNTKQALQLITNKLQDVNGAIDFCKEHNDAELWEDLINDSIDKPSFITGLLNNIGTHVDPIILIQKIHEGMEIPGLRDSLVKILQDYNLQISLREGCRKILVSDCFSLLQKLVKTQKKGIPLEKSKVCQGCNERVVTNDLRYANGVVVFFCRHAFHEDCLPAHNSESCLICSQQDRVSSAMSTPQK